MEIWDRYSYYNDCLSVLDCVEFLKCFATSRPVLLALLVGCGLQLFQQFSGINTVM